MRPLAALIVVSTLLFLSGCYTQSDMDEKDDQISELEERVTELETKLNETQAAAEELRSNVNRLENENWRDVVPDIEQSTSDLEAVQE